MNSCIFIHELVSERCFISHSAQGRSFRSWDLHNGLLLGSYSFFLTVNVYSYCIFYILHWWMILIIWVNICVFVTNSFDGLKIDRIAVSGKSAFRSLHITRHIVIGSFSCLCAQLAVFYWNILHLFLCRQPVFSGMYCTEDGRRQQVASITEYCTVQHKARLARHNSRRGHGVRCQLIENAVVEFLFNYRRW